MSPDNYRYAGGSLCPACQGTDLAHGRYDAEHPDTVTRRWACMSCGATWAAVYALTGYEGLRQPQEDTP